MSKYCPMCDAVTNCTENCKLCLEEENEWQQFRGEALEFMRNLETKLIEDWCAECKVTTPVGYYFNMSKKVVTIYTDRPGYLIGMKGSKVKQFEAAVEKELRRPYKVEFVEIRGGFANVGKREDDK